MQQLETEEFDRVTVHTLVLNHRSSLLFLSESFSFFSSNPVKVFTEHSLSKVITKLFCELKKMKSKTQGQTHLAVSIRRTKKLHGETTKERKKRRILSSVSEQSEDDPLHFLDFPRDKKLLRQQFKINFYHKIRNTFWHTKAIA